MELIIIAALAPGNALGRDGKLLFNISDDLRRFKSLTMGFPIIMGRKTFESFPKGPLPGRENIVITHNPCFHPAGTTVASSLQAAIDRVKGCEKAFIIGGGEIYRQALPLVQTLEITQILSQPAQPADTFFPPYDNWTIVAASDEKTDERTNAKYKFLTLKRKS